MRLDSVRRELPRDSHGIGKPNEAVNRHAQALDSMCCLTERTQAARIGRHKDHLDRFVLPVDVVDHRLQFGLGAARVYYGLCAAVGEGVGCCGREIASFETGY